MISQFEQKSFGQIVDGLGFTPEERDAFATLGIGTGGFGPLFGISFLEMLRLWIWDYSAEYTLPGEEVDTTTFATAMTDLIIKEVRKHYPNTNYTDVFKVQTPVANIWASNSKVEVDRAGGVDTFAFAIVGMTNRAMQSLHLSDNLVAPVEKGMYAPFNSPFGFYTDGPMGQAIASSVRYGIRTQNMISSSKTFVAARNVDPSKDDWWPQYLDRYNVPIRCTLTDSFTKSSYWLERKSSGMGMVALLSYTWGNDSLKLQSMNANRVGEMCLPFLGTTNGSAVLSAPYTKLADDIGGAQGVASQTIDWQTEPFFLGAFKLDAPGEYYATSSLAWHYTVAYKHSASDPYLAPYRRVYLAGDAASFYGGWVEGAAMSAINAATAIVALTTDAQWQENNRTMALLDPANMFFHGWMSIGESFNPRPARKPAQVEEAQAS